MPVVINGGGGKPKKKPPTPPLPFPKPSPISLDPGGLHPPPLPAPAAQPLPVPQISQLIRNLLAGGPGPTEQPIIQQRFVDRNISLASQPPTVAAPPRPLRLPEAPPPRPSISPPAVLASDIGGSIQQALAAVFGGQPEGVIGVPGGISPEILRQRIEDRARGRAGLGPSRLELGVTPATPGPEGRPEGPVARPDFAFDDPANTINNRANFVMTSLADGVRPTFIPFEVQSILGFTDDDLLRMGYRKGPNGWIKEEFGPATGSTSSAGGGFGGGFGGVQTIRIVGGGGRGSGGTTARSSGLINWRI